MLELSSPLLALASDLKKTKPGVDRCAKRKCRAAGNVPSNVYFDLDRILYWNVAADFLFFVFVLSAQDKPPFSRSTITMRERGKCVRDNFEYKECECESVREAVRNAC